MIYDGQKKEHKYNSRGLMDYRTTKFENDGNRPSCFQQLQDGITSKKLQLKMGKNEKESLYDKFSMAIYIVDLYAKFYTSC